MKRSTMFLTIGAMIFGGAATIDALDRAHPADPAGPTTGYEIQHEAATEHATDTSLAVVRGLLAPVDIASFAAAPAAR
ncbi:hypothetical protein ACWEVD_21635 [Nocardia thailandica]|uniref:Uncharacterized protein n=1 Tax=Nocardia thailandica TaxID=257275 RepID=A0ABW6PS24_9NOCA